MQFRFRVRGVDISTAVRTDSVKIVNAITHRIDTCSFKIDDPLRTLSIREHDEVIISNIAETVRYFGGHVADLFIDIDGITRTFTCNCQDYTSLVDTVLVNEIYDNMTDRAILTALFTRYLPEITVGTAFVEVGLMNRRLVLDRVTLGTAISRLASNSGFDWFIDSWRRLRYFSSQANLAPFSLSDAPDHLTTFGYSQLKYERDATQIINSILVRGGTYLSPDTTFELPGDGNTRELLLPYRMKHPSTATSLLVWVNTGTNAAPIWTAQGVGIDYLQALGGTITVLNNYMEKLLRFAVAPPAFLRAVRVTGRYEIPVLVRVRSTASRNLYGRWFEDIKIDSAIDDRTWATMVGKGILAENAFVKERGSLVCERDGLFAGQSLHIRNTARGLNGRYLINKLTTTILGGTSCQYKVEFGEYNPDLIDLLLIIKARAVQWQPRREDEKIIELFEHANTLSLVQAISSWSHATGQYAWGPHDGSAGLREMVWNFATWG